jgi:hypothetical protein
MFQDCIKPTPSVGKLIFAKPPKDAILSEDKPQDDIGHYAGKLTTSVAKSIIATPPQDAILGTDEPRDTTGHDVGNPTPSVATPVIATPQKHHVCRRCALGCYWTRRWKRDAERRDA